MVPQDACLDECAATAARAYAPCGQSCGWRFPDPLVHSMSAKSCLHPSGDCNLLRASAGLWILFIGDSTHRQLYEGALRVAARQGFNITMVLPHIGGRSIRNRDAQKDTDSICSWPHKNYCKPCAQYKRGRDPEQPLLLSFRFTRGLDSHKVEHVRKNWRQRFHYPEWRFRSAQQPPRMLLDSDPFDAHPLTREHFSSRDAPDLVIFNACAWDLPQINRSGYYYGYQGPTSCLGTQALTRSVYLEERRNGTVIKGNATARVLGNPCIRTGDGIPDSVIYADFANKLRATLQALRGTYPGRLVLRSCHAGTQDGRPGRDGRPRAQPQLESLVRMDSIVRRVARELCIELLDVFALDVAAGWHDYKGPGEGENFHVPPRASEDAARAALGMAISSPSAHPPPDAAPTITVPAGRGSVSPNTTLDEMDFIHGACSSAELELNIDARIGKTCRGTLQRTLLGPSFINRKCKTL